MSEYGLTAEGFSRKRLDLLLAELNDEMKSIFGDNFNVSPESPDGQINGVISESNANLWEIVEEAYNAYNPSQASGNTLSNLVQINNITRLPASESYATLTLTGNGSVLIPEGSVVSTSDGSVQFATVEDVTLDVSGDGSVLAVATTTGPLEAATGTITEIETPITGWLTVTNAADAIEGTNEETDPELRARREQSTGISGQSVIDSIYAAVANVEGVTKVTVLENDTDITDANGLPPHSFLVIAVGGLDDDIADVIWIKKPAGITAYGTTTVEVLDSQGLGHDISFSRPVEIDIYVEVDLTTYDDYPTDGDDLIKQAIVDYANGSLVAGRGFDLGEDVIYTRLYTPINSVPGHEIDDLQISIAFPASGTANIAISDTETSIFTVANIVVNS